MGDFGGKLRQARERRGVSLRQIATATKISVGVLEALERNDVSKLPGGIFSRAFVRSYATEVGLDPDETIREFLAEFPGEADTMSLHPPPPVASAAPHAPRVAPAPAPRRTPAPIVELVPDESEFESQQRMASVVLRLLMVSVPIVLVILYFSLRGGAPPPAPGVEAAPPSGSVPEAPPPPAPVDPPPPTGAATAGTQPATPAAAPARVPVGSTDQMIELRPTGPCWASLTIDGAPSFAREMRAGEREIRTFREEAVLRVGDAAACEFALNGRIARPLGGPGATRTIKVTPQNLTSYLP